MATQSVLRAQAYSRGKPGSSSGMFLLHLSMLSLLPLLFDSAHGHSAYGYARAGSSTSSSSSDGDPKGKAREIHTSAALDAPPASLDETPSFHSASENHPPIIGMHSYASPSNSSGSSSRSRNINYPTPPFKLSSPQTPSSRPQLPPEDARSASNDPPPPLQMEDLKASAKKMIHTLLHNPIPANLLSLSPETIQELPILQVCKLVNQMIGLDARDGNDPLKTVSEDVLSALICMADRSLSRDSSQILHEMALLDQHVQLLQLLKQAKIFDAEGKPTPYTMQDLYFHSLAEEVFNILESIKQSNLEQQQQQRQSTPTSPSLQTYLSSELANHALRLSISLQCPLKATTAWLSHIVVQKPNLNREEIDCLLHDHMPIFNQVIWPRIFENLSTTRLRTREEAERYVKAVSAYDVLFNFIKVHTPSKRYMYDALLQTLMDLPVPPVHDSSNASWADPAREAIERHEELFKASHTYLLQTLQSVLGSVPTGAEPLKHEYRITFKEGIWALYKIPRAAYAASSMTSSTSPTSSDPAAIKTISRDPQSLIVLLVYAYRHLQSLEIGELLFATWITRALTRRRERLPQAHVDLSQYCARRAACIRKGVDSYLKLHQLVDSIRIRECTLLRANELVESAFDECVERIAADGGMSEYVPPERPRKLKGEQLEEFEIFAARQKKYWQIDILLRCQDVNNALITAILQYWTTTSQFHFIRYFNHHLLTMRRQVELSSSVSSSNVGNISLTRMEPEEHPPLGLEMDFSTASMRIASMFSTPEILVSLLNAAVAMGNLSLAEKIWLVLCEKEESRQNSSWRVPTAAYTLMLEVYASEAARERSLTKSQGQSQPGGLSKSNAVLKHEVRKSPSRRSRITGKERIPLESDNNNTKAYEYFASAIYHRFADKMSIQDVDAKFFTAALRVFGDGQEQAPLGVKTQASFMSQSRGGVKCERADSSEEDISSEGSDLESVDSFSDSGFGSDGLSDTASTTDTTASPMVATVLEDVLASGFIVPEWTKKYARHGATGLLSHTSSSASRHKQRRARPPIVHWTTGSHKRTPKKVSAFIRSHDKVTAIRKTE